MSNKTNDKTTTIEELKKKNHAFIEERDWAQFHTPKNIAMSLTSEATEFSDFFIWVDSQKSIEVLEEKREAIEQEVADVLGCLLTLCALYDIDLAKAYEKKLKVNQDKYPVEKSKGHATKYTDL